VDVGGGTQKWKNAELAGVKISKPKRDKLKGETDFSMRGSQ
jgi:hypothetical protein